jgi:hypothetical protein
LNLGVGIGVGVVTLNLGVGIGVGVVTLNLGVGIGEGEVIWSPEAAIEVEVVIIMMAALIMKADEVGSGAAVAVSRTRIRDVTVVDPEAKSALVSSKKISIINF